MYIRTIKRKIYDTVIEQISKKGQFEPLSRICSIKLNFNQNDYILKIFADTSNKLVALEVIKYTHNTNYNHYECSEIRKSCVLGAMLEMLLTQCLIKN